MRFKALEAFVYILENDFADLYDVATGRFDQSGLSGPDYETGSKVERLMQIQDHANIYRDKLAEEEDYLPWYTPAPALAHSGGLDWCVFHPDPHGENIRTDRDGNKFRDSIPLGVDSSRSGIRDTVKVLQDALVEAYVRNFALSNLEADRFAVPSWATHAL